MNSISVLVHVQCQSKVYGLSVKRTPGCLLCCRLLPADAGDKDRRERTSITTVRQTQNWARFLLCSTPHAPPVPSPPSKLWRSERPMGTRLAAPVVGMVMAECAQVGLMVVGKAAMSKGMSSLIFVFYSNAFASLLLLPASLLFHRSSLSLSLHACLSGNHEVQVFLLVDCYGVFPMLADRNVLHWLCPSFFSSSCSASLGKFQVNSFNCLRMGKSFCASVCLSQFLQFNCKCCLMLVLLFSYSQLLCTDTWVRWDQLQLAHAWLGHAQPCSGFHLRTCHHFQVTIRVMIGLALLYCSVILLSNVVSEWIFQVKNLPISHIPRSFHALSCSRGTGKGVGSSACNERGVLTARIAWWGREMGTWLLFKAFLSIVLYVIYDCKMFFYSSFVSNHQ